MRNAGLDETPLSTCPVQTRTVSVRVRKETRRGVKGELTNPKRTTQGASTNAAKTPEINLGGSLGSGRKVW